MTGKHVVALHLGVIVPIIVVLAIFSNSLHDLSSPVVLKAFPSVPKEGEPVSVAFTLKNYDEEGKDYNFELYANGEEVMHGETLLPGYSERNYAYSHRNSLDLGEQISFLLKVYVPKEIKNEPTCRGIRIKENCLTSEVQVYEKSIAIPAYPPQVWSSFVSFAAFSTAISSLSSISTSTSTMSMASIAYYKNTYGFDQALNVGVIFSIVLLVILIQVELTEPFTKALNFLGRMKPRFNRLSMVLFIIFMSMVFTEIILVIG
jgi:hypothetical protein